MNVTLLFLKPPAYANPSSFSFRSPIIDFCGPAAFLFVLPTGADAMTFMTTMPTPTSIKRKCLVIVKARETTEEPGFECIAKEIIFLEINRPVLDNLYQLCHVSNIAIYEAQPADIASVLMALLKAGLKFKSWTTLQFRRLLN